MSGRLGLWRAPCRYEDADMQICRYEVFTTADMKILHRRVWVAVLTSQSLVSSFQVADRTRVLNYIDITLTLMEH